MCISGAIGPRRNAQEEGEGPGRNAQKPRGVRVTEKCTKHSKAAIPGALNAQKRTPKGCRNAQNGTPKGSRNAQKGSPRGPEMHKTMHIFTFCNQDHLNQSDQDMHARDENPNQTPECFESKFGQMLVNICLESSEIRDSSRWGFCFPA